MQDKRGRDVRVDVLWLAKRHLEGYRGQKEYVANLTEEQSGRCYEIQHMTVSYGENIGHSSGERSSAGEMLAEDEEYQDLKKKITDAHKVLDRIERTVRMLTPIEAKIIERRYFGQKPETWEEIAREVGYYERHCRRLHAKALWFIAISFYGLEAVFGDTRKR